MQIKHELCAECKSHHTIVIDDDEMGFEYDLYRKCLECGAIEDIEVSEMLGI